MSAGGITAGGPPDGDPASGRRSLPRLVGAGLALAIALVAGWLVLTSPSNDRDWDPTFARTAHATIDGDRVTLHDIRSFRYAPEAGPVPAWFDATYDLSELERTWFVLTEFGGVDGMAHVMVSFEFDEDRFVVFSVEARREADESYSPIGGAFRRYELTYVVADELDAIGRRTLVQQDSTWVIPMNAGPEASAAFFLHMVERLNGLHEEPEWYHTLWNSCSSNLADHYERVNDVNLGLDRRIFLPGFGDELLEELGLLPDGIDRATARELYLVNERALADGGSDDFSRAIRAGAAF